MTASSMIGINSIELIPGAGDPVVASRLRASLETAASLRAAVAYWCVGPKQLGPNLAKRFGGDGFLCVDVHLPTDIDILAQMVSAGANVFLYLKNPNPQPGELKMHFPPHLMHPKMLLFDYVSEPSELWVGSHNWTARALMGVNIEASLRLRLDGDAALYKDAEAFLNTIRLDSVAFDSNAVDYYKWLQGAALEDPLWVLELAGSRSVLEAHDKITVFGRTDEDYRNLRNVDKNLVVSLIEPGTAQELLYEAVVTDTGHWSGAGVALGSRLYAAQDGSARPMIAGPAIPPAAVTGTAKSWATIGLIDRLVGATYEVPPRERWVTEASSPDAARFNDLKPWFPKPERPLVQAAVSQTVFERGLSESELPKLPQAANRRDVVARPRLALESPPQLLRKKIVRAKRSDGTTFGLGKKKEKSDGDEV